MGVENSHYRILGGIDTPADLRRLPADALPQLAAELRRCLVESLARIGGHFAASLGTVELTLALHYLLDTPRDQLIWDVGHQAYIHKMLTGRRARLDSIRREGGLAPFPARDESPYDVFGAGHSSTSLSAAAGLAIARRQRGESHRVAAVIGDGGLTAGMAFEALNHIGAAGLPLLIVLNDNDCSISENVGALRDHAARTLARLGQAAPHAQRPPIHAAGRRLAEDAAAADDHAATADPGAWLQALGIDYAGPVDGHDLTALLAAIGRLRDHPRPVLLHAVTVKGKGYAPAEADPIGWHAVSGFDAVTGQMPPAAGPAHAYTAAFGDWLCETAARRDDVVAITPAMREGSGLVDFARAFPQRFHDVGIAEQHAVTLAAGMAAGGLRPVLAIYSTFLQRGYDQLIHDVALQELPVLFAIDRGGLVGGDGATHHGAFDLSYLRCIPHLTVMAPADEAECQRLLATGLALNGPSAVRYPRGPGPGATMQAPAEALPRLCARKLRQARGRRRPRVALLSFGSLLAEALQAAELLDASVYDMRFIKPLDADTVVAAADEHELLVSIEDNVCAGGAGSAVAELLARRGLARPLLMLGLPDRFIGHGSRLAQLAACGLDSVGIQRAVYERLRQLPAGQATAEPQRQGQGRPSKRSP